MLDVRRDANSPSNSKRNTSDLIRQFSDAVHPIVLTVNGEAESAEERESLRVAVEEMKAGKGRPIEEMLADMKRILTAASL